ncbi:uncharacterized protein SPPG_06065 [Spizellomyces punctatus DAOM BR117]|uniref:Transmembrane protein n=1 Tax=Spizellomyces punctatus (strain DAOM BR117) TaxID=645134 RepID=A0A0L0HAX8_SPIPD|nr:uncharacterized protein SPPG_06065 [Spizellomyces punctatus DAOM BR117]KNC98357.1 hypothetical protein SPPG_06065 [Spizellomyces punctatus DAOM BR117]|eukprot:XP_016606397.1 hypothetical protein SPPG_06065 [Spizellomyces punctatus DAOM BR117]
MAAETQSEQLSATDTDSESIVVVEKPSEEDLDESPLEQQDDIPPLVADDDKDVDATESKTSKTLYDGAKILLLVDALSVSAPHSPPLEQLSKAAVLQGDPTGDAPASPAAAAEPVATSTELSSPGTDPTADKTQDLSSLEPNQQVPDPITTETLQTKLAPDSGIITDDKDSSEGNEDAGIVTDDEGDEAEALRLTSNNYDKIEDEMAEDLREARHHVVQPPTEQQPAHDVGILEEIWNSIFTPGVNSRVQGVMNLSFAGLFLSLTALAVATGGNMHVLALMAIAICLFLSVQWFLRELARMPPPPAEPIANTGPSKKTD